MTLLEVLLAPAPYVSVRESFAFASAGLAILLRIASDWLFPTGGPFPYQLLQALLLAVALGLLGSRLDLVFLKGGQPRRGLREAAFALPLALVGGLVLAWIRFGGPQWPTSERALLIIGNNLFFPVVEEVEFRGFLLAWVLRRTKSGTAAVWVVALVHVLAHAHWIWERNLLMLGLSLTLFAWYGGLTVRTRSLWGAIAAHAIVNILGFLPTTGHGARTP